MRSGTSSRTTSCAEQNKDQKPCNSDSSDDDDDNQWVDINDDDEYSDSSASDNGLAGSSKPLVELLEEYYQEKVKVPDGEVTAVKAVVDQVAQSIHEYLHGRHANLLQGDVFVVDNADLAVQHPNRFVVTVPLGLETNLWKTVDAKNTVLKAPGYSLIHRINTDFFRPGSSVWDRFTVGTYLNSELIQRFLEGVLQKVANKGFTFNYDDYYITKSDKALTLEIIQPVGGLIDHLTVQVITRITLEGPDGMVSLEGIPHGCLTEPVENSRQNKQHGENNPYENLWYQSSRTQELEMFETMDEDGGCRRKCLQILQAMSGNQSPLCLLSEYQLQTVLLHLCEEESEWEDVMMAERFLDLLKRLEQFLEDGCLPHLHHPEMNLFEGFSSRQLGRIKTWLEKRLKLPDRIYTLLV